MSNEHNSAYELEFHKACRAGDITKIKSMLAQIPDMANVQDHKVHKLHRWGGHHSTEPP